MAGVGGGEKVKWNLVGEEARTELAKNLSPGCRLRQNLEFLPEEKRVWRNTSHFQDLHSRNKPPRHLALQTNKAHSDPQERLRKRLGSTDSPAFRALDRSGPAWGSWAVFERGSFACFRASAWDSSICFAGTSGDRWGTLPDGDWWTPSSLLPPRPAPSRRTPCWDRCAHACELSPLGETQLFGRLWVHTQQSMELHDEVVDGKENENSETTSSRTAWLVFPWLSSRTGIVSIASNL